MSDKPLVEHLNYFNCFVSVTKRHDPKTEDDIKCLTTKLSHLGLPDRPPQSDRLSLLSRQPEPSSMEKKRHYCLQKMIEARQHQADRWGEIVTQGAVLASRLDMAGDRVAARRVRQIMYIYRDMLEDVKEDINIRMRLFRIVARPPIDSTDGIVSI